MLNKIPKILPSQLVKMMMDMGHGDELVIGDGNYPAEAMGLPVVHMDGHGVPEVLDAILELFPLDSYVASPTAIMEIVPGDDFVPVIWDEYRKILKNTVLRLNRSMWNVSCCSLQSNCAKSWRIWVHAQLTNWLAAQTS